MRPLEMLAVAVLTVAIVVRVVRAAGHTQAIYARWARALPWIALLLLLAHVLLEGGRWQLFPAYLVALLLAVRAARRTSGTGRPRTGWSAGRIISSVGALFLVALSVVLAVGFPVFEYAPPTGRYGVGTTRLSFVDSARTDPFAPVATQPRKLLAAVWYPADVSSGAPRAPFWPSDTDVQAAIGLPAFVTSHLSLVRSHASPDVPLAGARARWPVIIYSHGYNSSPWQNVVQMEDLASHGFVVMSIGHTHDASRLTFPDGEVIRDNSRARASRTPADEWVTLPDLTSLDSIRDPDSARAKWRRMEARMTQGGMYMMPSIDVWYEDTRFIMDRLAAIQADVGRDPPDALARIAVRLDLARLGVAGMSFGGSTAGVTCMRDARCKAGANLDGWQFGEILDHPLRVPFLFMSHEGNSQFPVYFGSSADLLHVEVRGATHGSFGDIALAMPFFRWIARPNIALVGTIEGEAVERIMSRYLVAFFTEYLLGEPQALLRAASPPADLRDATLTIVRPSPRPGGA